MKSFEGARFIVRIIVMALIHSEIITFPFHCLACRYWNKIFSINPHVRLLVSWSVTVTLRCSSRSTCFVIGYKEEKDLQESSEKLTI